MEIDLDQPILENSKESEVLFLAWKQRQAELKEAMKTILQPAEHMGNLTKQLNGTESNLLSIQDKEYILSELASLLDDVDNAKDFHTIGGWPTLVRHLAHTQAKSVRSYAAWAIGNAVKNTYDYQLWVLERISIELNISLLDHTASSSSTDNTMFQGENNNTYSCIELLIDMLDPMELPPPQQQQQQGEQLLQLSIDSSAMYDMQKRALYAIASSIRGNLDVQNAVIDITSTIDVLNSTTTATITSQSRPVSKSIKYLEYMYFLSQLYMKIPSDVSKKIWSSLADLLEERTYIHNELQNDIKVLVQQHTVNESVATSDNTITIDETLILSKVEEENNSVKVINELNRLQSMVLLGDNLISDSKWFTLSTDVVIYYVNYIKQYNENLKKTNENFHQTIDFNAIHSSLRSVLIFCKEILNTRVNHQSSEQTIIPQNFINAINYVLHHFDKDIFEDLIDVSIEIHTYVNI